jgi:TfoX/Sxy family transcriptional regulator of competence genes
VGYDASLARRIRGRVGDHPALTEREMFGRLAFMIGGNMAGGIIGDELMVRVGKEAHEEAVARPGARIMAFTRRPMAGWIVVDRTGIEDPADFERWVYQGVAYAESLPAK